MSIRCAVRHNFQKSDIVPRDHRVKFVEKFGTQSGTAAGTAQRLQELRVKNSSTPFLRQFYGQSEDQVTFGHFFFPTEISALHHMSSRTADEAQILSLELLIPDMAEFKALAPRVVQAKKE
jgi:hypothetical protein